MAKQFNFENTSEEVFDFVCGPCHVDGDMLQAKGYCYNCQDYLCDFCMKQHLRPKPMRHHVLLDEKSMPKDKSATPTNLNAFDMCTERCQNHSGNIIEYYCQSHDFLCCTKCFISDNHKKCEGFVCIEDATAGLYESQEYKTYTGKIGQIVDDLSRSSAVQQENEENIKMYSIRAKREITIFRKSINEVLDKLENEMDKQVLQMKESRASNWMTTSKQIEKLDKDIRQIQHTKEHTRNSGQKCNSYINMKRNLHQLKQLEDCMVTIIEENTVLDYIFKPDARLQNVLKDTKTFGKLVTSREDQIDNSALIDALEKLRIYYQEFNRSFFDAQTILRYGTYSKQCADVIKSVEAGRRVDVDSLPAVAIYGNPILSQSTDALWDTYNSFHGYNY